MKLYAKDGQVYFDYTDVDTKAGLNGKTMDYRRFMRETSCWDNTDTPQIVRMAYKPSEWETEYGNICRLSGLLSFCEFQAKYNHIETDTSFNEFYIAISNRCDELRAIEKAKAEKEKAEAEAKAKWQGLCKYGCGRCSNKRRCDDDYFCTVSGDLLPEENVHTSVGRVYLLFNYTAFPTENCPFNINKNKETNIYET